MRRTLAAAATLAVLALAALTACDYRPADVVAPTAGPAHLGDPTWAVACAPGTTPVEPLGDLELPCLGDEAPTAVGVQEGRPLVIVLWASWCGPCVEEAPEIEAFYQAYGDQIDVLGVDTADPRDAGRWFAQDFDLTYPSVFDQDQAIRVGLGVPALPGIAFVSPDGTVAELITEPGVTTEKLTETAEAAFGLELA